MDNKEVALLSSFAKAFELSLNYNNWVKEYKEKQKLKEDMKNKTVNSIFGPIYPNDIENVFGPNFGSINRDVDDKYHILEKLKTPKTNVSITYEISPYDKKENCILKILTFDCNRSFKTVIINGEEWVKKSITDNVVDDIAKVEEMLDNAAKEIKAKKKRKTLKLVKE